MKKALAIALAVVFVLAFTVPAFAQSMTHTVKEVYEDAIIDIERQHGHLCNTGAELKYSVKGTAAEFMAERAITQVQGVITVSKDEAAWIAWGPGAGLTVTSVITLCAPAKHEQTITDYVYGDLGWVVERSQTRIPSVFEGYALAYDGFDGSVFNDSPDVRDTILWAQDWDAATRAFVVGLAASGTAEAELALGQLAAALTDGFWSTVEYEALTEQIWAVQVFSEPGFSGNLEQTWEAAYGKFAHGGFDEDGNYGFLAADATHPAAFKDSFMFQTDATAAGGVGVSLGADYVGNYFTMDQHARTSQGHVYRYIDISSPISHAYVSEYAEVTGKAEVHDAFAMLNIGPGADIATDWWDLF